MVLTLQLQLLPDQNQADALRATMLRFNEAANWLAGKAFERGVTSAFTLHKMCYKETSERFVLSAQMAVRCLAQVCEAYKKDQTIRPAFKPLAAIPYDERILSFKKDGVSLLTLDGRIVVPVTMGKMQRQMLDFPHGQADLQLRSDGKWFLLQCIEVPEEAVELVIDWLGIDLGQENILVDSDGVIYSGAKIDECRVRYQERRAELQRAAAGRLQSKARRRRKQHRPRAIRRALRRMGRREARFHRDVNHCLSKRVVGKAKGTGRGIAMEDLTGIHERTRFRKAQRARAHGWSFAQLRSFIEYKAALAGVDFKLVDPAYTSQRCPRCGHCEKANRKSQSEFCCKACGFEQHADIVGARNVRAGALVMAPMVSDAYSLHGSHRVA